MRNFLFAAIVAISAMLAAAPWPAPAKGELPAPGEVRLFWQTELLPSPRGAPRPYWGPSRAITMPDGGVLILVPVSIYRSIIIRLDRSGDEQWRIVHSICPSDEPVCSNWQGSDITPVATPDNGFLLVTRDALIEEYDAEGQLRRVLDPPGRLNYPRAILPVGNDVFYLAYSRMTETEVPRDCCLPAAEIVRWSTEQGTIWRLPLRLQYSQPEQSGFPVDLDMLSNGDLLWTMRGNDDRLTLVNVWPIDSWQVRVDPTGAIRPPGPLETSLDNSAGSRRLLSSHALPDGRLLRIVDVRDSEGRWKRRVWEFWDETGSTRLASIANRPRELGYLDARGRHAFYMRGFFESGQYGFVGFDSEAMPVQCQSLPYLGYAFGDGTTSRVFILRNVVVDDRRRRMLSIYLTSVE